jgi:Mg2+/Co2+ transporter CorC
VCAGITNEGVIYVLKARIRKESVQRAETNTIHKDTRIEGTLPALIENGIIRFYKADTDQKELIDELLHLFRTALPLPQKPEL